MYGLGVRFFSRPVYPFGDLGINRDSFRMTIAVLEVKKENGELLNPDS
jgi:hypothetical protein